MSIDDYHFDKRDKNLIEAVLDGTNSLMKEAVKPLEKDIKEIKDNHLKHIDLRLNKLETDASQTDLRLSNLEKGQAKLEAGQKELKQDISEIKDIVSKQ